MARVRRAHGLGTALVLLAAISAEAQTEHTLTAGGRQRTYQVHDFAPDGARAPVVIVLHGGGGNADNAVQMTGFDRIARSARAIAVYPNGTGGRLAQQRNILLTWNAGHCCAAAMENAVNDVAFIEAIIDTLVASGRADASRIYVTGMSNGAMLTHRVGRELSHKVAAIAPVVGAVFGDEPAPRSPVPAFIVVGAEDAVVPPQGGALQLRGVLGNRSAADRDVAPAIEQARYWTRHNGCGEPVRSESSASVKTEWRSCRGGTAVVFHNVKDNGHAWPGGRPGREGAAQPTPRFDATAEMWVFFAQFKLSAPK